MNSRQVITLAAAAVCAAVGLAAAGYEQQQAQAGPVLRAVETQVKEPREESLPTPEETAPAGPAYRLGASEGRLAVFVEGQEQPEMVLDVYLASLPEADRILLEQGIPAGDYARLVSLLEDYIS